MITCKPAFTRERKKLITSCTYKIAYIRLQQEKAFLAATLRKSIFSSDTKKCHR